MTPAERERGERLRAHVEAVKGKPIEWSVDDCSPWAAQWISDLTGIELDWPVYASREEAEAIIARAGGLVNIWNAIARQAGISECRDGPRVGDVGIIMTSFGQVGGIFAHGGVFCWRAERGARTIGVGGRTYPFRMEDGTVENRPLIVKAWQV